MPTPEKPYVIGVKTSGATASTESYVTFRNRTTDEYRKVKLANNEALCNMTELTNNGADSGTHTAYSNGDVIEIIVSGYAFGGATHTVDTSTKKNIRVEIALTNVSSTNTVAVSF